jgi:TPP-dependent pyruvate/acetoin dehydrogenase alpha subunit
VTAVFFGEGAVAEGEFHESMNLAALWNLPVLFCCENNLYAMGTALDRSQSQLELTLKASSYQMPAWAVDGLDVLAVEEAARMAVEGIRGGGGPHFLELRTYRFRAHSMFDPELYRDKAEQMRTAGLLSDDEWKKMNEDAAAEVDEAVAFAEAGTWEPVEELTRFVYSEGTSR